MAGWFGQLLSELQPWSRRAKSTGDASGARKQDIGPTISGSSPYLSNDCLTSAESIQPIAPGPSGASTLWREPIGPWSKQMSRIRILVPRDFAILPPASSRFSAIPWARWYYLWISNHWHWRARDNERCSSRYPNSWSMRCAMRSSTDRQVSCTSDLNMIGHARRPRYSSRMLASGRAISLTVAVGVAASFATSPLYWAETWSGANRGYWAALKRY